MFSAKTVTHLVKYFFIIFFTVALAQPFSSSLPEPSAEKPFIPFYDQNYIWVDSLMRTMTVDEKIGQLFMVPAYSNKDAAHESQVEQLIKKYKVGGLIFMQGGPVRQARLCNDYQAISKTPLLIAMDAEWGPAMRLDSIISFQRQLTWGAVQDDSLIYETGKIIAEQLKRLGVQVSFSPVVDVNNNINNPVIGDRSFGEDKFNVALKGLAYMNGLQENGIIACGKHFPGHGDVTTDSHLTLPVINHDKTRLDTLEMYPFKVLMNQGLGSIMLAHLFIPSLDNTTNTPTSLSKKVGTDILRDSLHFRGLVFSDALNMKGASMHYKPGELEVKAFLAGNDVLLFSEDVPTAFIAIKKAVNEGGISMQRLDESVTRILKAKAFTGLDKYKPVMVQNLWSDLNSSEATLAKRSITEKSITLANAIDSMIPFKRLDTVKFASLSIADGDKKTIQEYLSKYAKFEHFVINKNSASSNFDLTLNKLKDYDVVVVSIHDMMRSASKNFGVTENTVNFLKKLTEKTKVVVTVFGSPYALDKFETAQYLIAAYDEEKYTQQAVAMALFGAMPFEGKLPVSSGVFQVNDGMTTGYMQRLKYTIPEDVGIQTAYLKKIDSIVKATINNKAAPGCQVLVAKEGKVIWDKAYGTFTYGGNTKVSTETLYDLASMTKISATTLSLMKLYDDSLFFLNKTVGDYLADTKGTEIEKIKMNQMLMHEAGLVAWIPFYKQTLTESGILNPLYYNQNKIKGFTTEVAKGVYMRDDYQDTIWNIIKTTPLKEKKYVYSDLAMFISKRIIEQLADEKLDTYIKNNFYLSLGMQTTCYNPITKFPKDRIAPTEDDNYFRFQLIQGYVHDMGAAMMGGIEGHAGLFSNAEDIAILYQMYLNGGSYGGTQYLNPETIKLFTGKRSDISRRGYGFDKPDMQGTSPCSSYASSETFGHLGFTGTCVWVDPKYDLVYIFLSNRVYPSSDPNRLNSENTRIKIMDVIYEAMMKSEGSTASMN
ncbi:MAG: glycoside hydrolase family 3 N-terminal domain-containing protein [Chitinophagales bacterium]